MAAQQEKKLGLGSVVSISVGLIIATVVWFLWDREPEQLA